VRSLLSFHCFEFIQEINIRILPAAHSIASLLCFISASLILNRVALSGENPTLVGNSKMSNANTRLNQRQICDRGYGLWLKDGGVRRADLGARSLAGSTNQFVAECQHAAGFLLQRKLK
jgi:hypothetical protein